MIDHRGAVPRLMLGGALGILVLAGSSCNGPTPPDPYIGTEDASNFDSLFGTDPKNSGPLCMPPRLAYGADGLTTASWYYLGLLSQNQLDITNSTDPNHTPLSEAYVISGCQPNNTPYDPRLDNYVLTEQYPILGGNISFPTYGMTAAYKPWSIVVPAQVQPGRQVGCNDVKSEMSVQNRAGYSMTSKVWNQGSDRDLTVMVPTAAQMASGMVGFKDWPIFNVGAPLMKTTDMLTSCPLTTGSTAQYPMYPGDPNADFQFPPQNWVSGLLGGYLDGGDLPTTTDPNLCGQELPAGNTCKTTGCICPTLNTVYMSSAEVLTSAGKVSSSYIGAGTVTLSATVDGTTMTRTAQLLATFTALPGQAGYSPVCQLMVYDPTKVNCMRKEAEVIAPRPLCTVAELQASPATAFPTIPTTYVHCLFPTQSN